MPRENAFYGLEKNDTKLAMILTRAGLDRDFAHVLVFINKKGQTTAKEIQKGTRLNQPDVSITTTWLREYRWVAFDLRNRGKGRGRPIQVYRIAVDFEDILTHFIEKNKMRMESIAKDTLALEQLKRT